MIADLVEGDRKLRGPRGAAGYVRGVLPVRGDGGIAAGALKRPAHDGPRADGVAREGEVVLDAILLATRPQDKLEGVILPPDMLLAARGEG